MQKARNAYKKILVSTKSMDIPKKENQNIKFYQKSIDFIIIDFYHQSKIVRIQLTSDVRRLISIESF